MSYTGATTVSTLHVYDSALYAGGTFTTAGSASVNHVAKWDGATWSDVGGGASYTGATTVSTLTTFQNTLVAGGSFNSLGTIPANNIGYWDGSNWGAFGTGTDLSVLSSSVLGDTLYAGGLFLSAGGNLTPFVAEWSPTAGIITSDPDKETNGTSFIIYPNPASEKISVKFSFDHKLSKNNYTFKLFNLLGEQIISLPVNNEIVINRNIISSGLYIYQITRDEIILSQGKIVFK